ncbi:alpha/beta hydrolase [Corynebacterium timonense]|uniref:Lysophospholipase, alpha-beta hydrolase superfamily n=1 Tax=Corynebacterium timonense TaxID=441500 RepID=A0A1H1N1K9_9CORY|nr:alpha/beta hydrolase [Corynebacterium timonense]SDR93001.1 Lysophospholipase, alpha-beta hydrolase superfamily [Corynebacterium timonense]
MRDNATPASLTLENLPWHDDILGEGFESAELPVDDPEAGTERATLVRALPDEATEQPAILWVHGMSDYFFQKHVAQHYQAAGYAFYAIDLRRCGRSRHAGEYWHYTTDLAEYFPELTTALSLIAGKHGSVVPLAHSTGGLIVPLWMDALRRNDPEAHSALQGLILNSPWLDLQFPPVLVKILRAPVLFLGKHVPTLRLPKAGTGTYGQSVSATEHGQWHFDTDKKPVTGHLARLGWVRAVMQGQRHVHKGEVDTGVPTLTVCSSHSYLGKPYSAAADTADTVLDVEQIKRWAPTLSDDATVVPIDGALHDVFLSEPHAREAAFAAVDSWLGELPAQD